MSVPVESRIQLQEDAPLLEVENASIDYSTSEGYLRAVDDISFTVDEDETFGLVGESGCGKSTMARSILGLLPDNGEVSEGAIRFKGVDISDLSREEMNQIRWKHVSMISQGAMNALNPVHKISSQIIESIQAHKDVSDSEARERVAELFELVGLDPDRMDEYPHQFSGGMKQRAYIAMALSLDPELIIADEPTTALDVIVQDQILKRIKELQEDLGISMILISHDISVIAETCNRLGVMYAGKMMEYGDLKSIFGNPHNPYMLGLQNAFPTLSGERQELISIPGSPPNLVDPAEQCRFVERCPFAEEECYTQHPPLERIEEDHFSACFRHDEVELLRERAAEPETWGPDQ